MKRRFPRTFQIFVGSVLFGALMLQPNAHARTLSIIYSFKGGSDGSNPVAGVTMDSSGNLYGTTSKGGGSGCSGNGCGTVFKVAPDGTETLLHAFQGGNDGATPLAGVVLDSSGNLYGTTVEGTGSGCVGGGCGTVFKVTPNGTETVLYTFKGGTDGWYPSTGVVFDDHGYLYGTTSQGGTYDYGTVYKVSPNGTEQLLHSFSGADGWRPGPLLIDPSGNLFGTAPMGGSGHCPYGCGTVFELTPEGNETVLYSFPRKPDGVGPSSGLTMDGQGRLYGTTYLGGDVNVCRKGQFAAPGCGTVFRVSPKGKGTVLHRFTNGTDGGYPYGPGALIMDESGNLYGAAGGGKKQHPCDHYWGCGVIFKLKSDGAETVLYTFQGGKSGVGPALGVVSDQQGNLYGTTYSGGLSKTCCGIVYKLTR